MGSNKDRLSKLGLISGAVQRLVGEGSLLRLGLVVVSREVLKDKHLLSESSLQDVFSILDLSMGAWVESDSVGQSGLESLCLVDSITKLLIN